MYPCYGTLGLTDMVSIDVLKKAMGDSHPFWHFHIFLTAAPKAIWKLNSPFAQTYTYILNIEACGEEDKSQEHFPL